MVTGLRSDENKQTRSFRQLCWVTKKPPENFKLIGESSSSTKQQYQFTISGFLASRLAECFFISVFYVDECEVSINFHSITSALMVHC